MPQTSFQQIPSNGVLLHFQSAHLSQRRHWVPRHEKAFGLAVLFQDGGLIALGANTLNMAVIACLVGYYVYVGLQRLLGARPWVNLAGAFVAAWLSVFVTSLACAVQLGLSGSSPIQVALPAMAGIHALIGVGEGLITAAALAFITATRRDLIQSRPASNVGGP